MNDQVSRSSLDEVDGLARDRYFSPFVLECNGVLRNGFDFEWELQVIR